VFIRTEVAQRRPAPAAARNIFDSRVASSRHTETVCPSAYVCDCLFHSTYAYPVADLFRSSSERADSSTYAVGIYLFIIDRSNNLTHAIPRSTSTYEPCASADNRI